MFNAALRACMRKTMVYTSAHADTSTVMHQFIYFQEISRAREQRLWTKHTLLFIDACCEIGDSVKRGFDIRLLLCPHRPCCTGGRNADFAADLEQICRVLSGLGRSLYALAALPLIMSGWEDSWGLW